MAIDIDFDSISSVSELANAIMTSLSQQTTSYTGEVTNSLASFVSEAGGNCDIFGGALGMARSAGSEFKTKFKELAKSLQDSFAWVATLAAGALKSVGETVGLVSAKLAEFSSWLSTQAGTVLAAAQGLLNSFKLIVNTSFSAISDVMASCMGFLTEIKNKMLDAVSLVSLRACEPMANAVNSIGLGAGIDSIYNAISQVDVGKFAEVALADLTESMGTMYESLTGMLGQIPAAEPTNLELSTLMQEVDNLMGA